MRLWPMAAGSRDADSLARGENGRRGWSSDSLLAGVSPGGLACPVSLGVREDRPWDDCA
ncbi:MAG TPA: hypothetical protein VOA88_02285 [Candidatus Dormibacteraeota bacterium]|nr:hypothetical protein [Candidatus Dormibacteraeota bacterium]